MIWIVAGWLVLGAIGHGITTYRINQESSQPWRSSPWEWTYFTLAGPLTLWDALRAIITPPAQRRIIAERHLKKKK